MPRQVKTILPAAFLEVQSGFGQSKMTLFDKDSSILGERLFYSVFCHVSPYHRHWLTHSPTNINIYIGRAVAIHKFQDIGRHVPLDDGFCEPTCGIQTTENEKVYPKDGEGKLRACGTNTGKVKFDDLGIQDKILKHKVTQPAFASYRTSTKNVVARYPGQKVTGKPDVWYNVKIKQKPLAQSGLFEVQYDDAMACARRQSAHYLKATSQRTVFEVADVSTALYTCPLTCSHVSTYISVCWAGDTTLTGPYYCQALHDDDAFVCSYASMLLSLALRRCWTCDRRRWVVCLVMFAHFGGWSPTQIAVCGLMAGIVGRMNPNKGNVDVTKPAASISEISCYMRVSRLCPIDWVVYEKCNNALDSIIFARKEYCCPSHV